MNKTTNHPTSPVGVWFALAGKTHLAQYRYNPETLEFDLQFKGNDQAYRYSNVAIETVNGFRDCSKKDSLYSHGEFFVNRIKNAYECRKLSEDEAK